MPAKVPGARVRRYGRVMSELPEKTGDERVDAVLAGLGDLAERPVGEHVAVFDQAFSGLEAALGSVDGQMGDQ